MHKNTLKNIAEARKEAKQARYYKKEIISSLKDAHVKKKKNLIS
jgi:hypothetical protein